LSCDAGCCSVNARSTSSYVNIDASVIGLDSKIISMFERDIASFDFGDNTMAFNVSTDNEVHNEVCAHIGGVDCNVQHNLASPL